MEEVRSVKFDDDEVAILRAVADFSHFTFFDSVDAETARELRYVAWEKPVGHAMLTQANVVFGNLSSVLSQRLPIGSSATTKAKRNRLLEQLTIVAKAESVVREALAMLRDKDA